MQRLEVGGHGDKSVLANGNSQANDLMQECVPCVLAAGRTLPG